MHALPIPIDYTPPYSIHYHAREGAVRRSFRLHGAPVVLELVQAAPDAPVEAVAHSDRPLEPLADSLGEAAHHVASADLELVSFRHAVAGDAAMAALAARLHGLKPLRIPDLWTSLLRSLLSQQISGAAARAIERKLAGRFGQTIVVGDELVPVLPDPATVLAAPDEELRGAGLSARKAEYARALAERVLDGTLDFERLQAMELEEVVATMTTIRGVGRWTAECTALFGLGHRDVLPGDDLGIRKGIALLDGMADLPTPAAVRQRGEAWAGWRSVASIYLWRSLEV